MRRTWNPCVYMLANRPRGTIYIGVTSDLVVRICQHRNADVDGFTKRHRIHDLVWYEQHERMDSAISRETSLKAWKRLWKLQLIESANPQWRDLYPDIIR